MKTQVKVPKEIQELFIEADACGVILDACTWWPWPTPKALYYAIRQVKVQLLAWRSLEKVFPAVTASWVYNRMTGMAYAPESLINVTDILPKKTRKPRAPKAVVVVTGVSK